MPCVSFLHRVDLPCVVGIRRALLEPRERPPRRRQRRAVHDGLAHARYRRVEVARADYGNFLRGEADDAWDVVYFDPMFATTVAAARGLDMIRRLARAGGPTSADIDQARRVARRRVVMKDRLPGPELERLGFTAIHQGRRVCYGALDAL